MTKNNIAPAARLLIGPTQQAIFDIMSRDGRATPRRIQTELGTQAKTVYDAIKAMRSRGLVCSATDPARTTASRDEPWRVATPEDVPAMRGIAAATKRRKASRSTEIAGPRTTVYGKGRYTGTELHRNTGLPESRFAAFALPSRIGNRLHYPGGRVELVGGQKGGAAECAK
jgi:hypothetical protein